MLTCGALTAPRHQANTESIASLKTEENESAIQTPGRDECLDPKRSAHNSAQKGHTAQWRYGQQAFQRGNHIGQGGHEGNQESVSGQHCLQTHNRSKVEPSPSLRDPGGVGGSTPCGSVYTSGHVRRTGASSRDGTGVEKCHRAGPHSCPHQQPHIIGVQFTGQGLVHNQDAERTASAYLPFTGSSLMI